jgi:hypothetical protein
MDYTLWPNEIWTIQLPTAATDLGIYDTLTFELDKSIPPKIQITKVTCLHSGFHDGGAWKDICIGSANTAKSTTAAIPFIIESSGSILTCNLISAAAGGAPCWTATGG